MSKFRTVQPARPSNAGFPEDPVTLRCTEWELTQAIATHLCRVNDALSANERFAIARGIAPWLIQSLQGPS